MTSFVSKSYLQDFSLWKKIKDHRVPLDFYLEITARCNNNCHHCYINLPAGDLQAQRSELTLSEISNIADQAVELGAMWCLITGGEPLLRKDFFDIYLALKKKGLLVSLFTNACLVTEEHIELFKKYPPQYIEVTVYGISEEVYERVTRKTGSYTSFRRGLDLLLGSGIKIKLKTMALRSNLNELSGIAAFCRGHSDSIFRFDPLLHLRYDQDPVRNKQICQERLTPDEIVEIEQVDEERSMALQKGIDHFIFSDQFHIDDDYLFHCGAGKSSFTVSYDGIFRLCSGLWHPDTVYDLRNGTLEHAWNHHIPKIRNMRTENPEILQRCRNCPIVNLCMNCPAHAYLETGSMEAVVPYFCQVAHARAAALKKAEKERS